MEPQNIQFPQINITNVSPETGLRTVEEVGRGFLTGSGLFWALIAIGLVLILFILFLLLKFYLRKITRTSAAFQKVVLLITVPKESIGEEAQKKSIKELLSPTETFFDNIGGLRAQRGWRSSLVGRTDHFSFEIVTGKDGVISFYVTIPKYLQQFVEQQIHAQYPSAQIDEVEDYNIFSPQCVIESAYLKLRNHWMFPIKTYLHLEGADPLNAIINSLSKIEQGDAAAIQIVARSARGEWHQVGARVASEVQQGKKLKEVMGKKGTLSGLLEIFSPKTESKEKKEKERPYQLSPMEQEIVKSLEEKSSKAGLDVNLRILVVAKNKEKAKNYLQNIVNAFAQYTGYEYGNGFKPVMTGHSSKIIRDFIYRNFDEGKGFILNTEEMTSIFHLPLPTTETPNIRWLLAKKAPAPVNIPTEGLILGKNVYRGQEKLIRIKDDDRRRHVYIIGKTGTGKSWLIGNMVIQDILAGHGVGVIDPHGDLIERILLHIPKERADDVVLFNPSDTERPIGLNMLEAKTEEQRDFAVQEMVAIFYKLFPPEVIGPMFEHNMRNVMLTLMADIQNPGTIAEIPRMFSDPEFAAQWVKKVRDPVVRAFWEKEMAKTTEFHKSEMLGYLISKVGRFVENEMMRNIIGQSHSGFNFREIMDNQKILLVNLSKGKTGEVNANLLGLILVSKLQMAAMGRADMPEEQRKDFYLYIDEFQNFITESITTILSEARKYRLCLNLAHQYLGQLLIGNDPKYRDAVLGTVGTMIIFKIGVEDAQFLAKEFAPVFNEYDLINIEKFNAYVKLLVDNQATRPFNMQTLPKVPGIPPANPEIAQQIKELSRMKYGRPKEIVEMEILERSKLGEPERKMEMGLEKNL
ncbi:MAG: type IV secretory system conjugative DNA transfer family protein [Patescibacteria group bacterium]